MDKIFMKLGWPGALVLLVGFLSLAIYIVVNRAIVENEQIEKASTSEQSTADTSDIEVSKNNNQDQGSSETESVAMNKEDATLIVKQSSLEDKVSEEKLANAQDLKKKSDLITPNENDTPKRGVETNETNQKLTQDDKSITNLEEIKELNNAEVMKTEEGLLQGSTDGGSKEESETKVDESGVTVISGKTDAGSTDGGSKEESKTKVDESGVTVIAGKTDAGSTDGRSKEESETKVDESGVTVISGKTDAGSTDGGSKEESETKVDILRVDESGVTVIAGKTEAGTTVKAKIGTEVIGTVESDEDGDFVIVGQISLSEDARELKLLTRDENKEDKAKSNEGITEPAWVVSSNSFFILPSLVKEPDDDNLEEKKINTVSIIEVKEDDLLLKQDPYPIGVEKVSLDRIKYSSDGIAILFGRCRSDMAVLVYLDNVLHRKVQPANDGSWSLDLGTITPGVYMLRLDEVDSQGTVLSRIESPFKQEAKDLLDKLFAEAITVQPGNSLWRIARRIYGRGIMYMEIYKKNDHLIKDPDLIYPGQVFSLLD